MGGDTVATPGPMMFSLTAIGTVPTGQMIRRSGARVGDEVWVTGTIGDAGLGLKVLDGALEAGSEDAFLADRYLLPRPRVTTGGALRGLASACVDISDGLVADASHLAGASGVALEIEAPLVPLSPAATALVAGGAASLEALFTAGDDFELCFTAAPGVRDLLIDMSRGGEVALTRIGRVVQGDGISLLSDKGEKMSMNASGYNHFAS
jgi:thiamine-monophosphate kinase